MIIFYGDYLSRCVFLNSDIRRTLQTLISRLRGPVAENDHNLIERLSLDSQDFTGLAWTPQGPMFSSCRVASILH